MRTELKRVRRALSDERRFEAMSALLTSLLPSLSPYRSILSFVTLSTEIDTSPLNRALASLGKLLLPRTCEEGLKIYRSDDVEVRAEEIDLVLVPGLGFDRHNNRIGYGKGYYDRFLSAIPACPTIGIGFKEQLVEALPVEPTDFALTSICLF